MLVSRFADKNCNCNRPQLAGLAAQYPRHSQYQIICREASWLHVARSGSVCLHLYKSSTQATHQYAPPNQPSSGHSTRSSLHLNIEDKQIFIYDQRYINEQNRNQIILYFDHNIKHIKTSTGPYRSCAALKTTIWPYLVWFGQFGFVWSSLVCFGWADLSLVWKGFVQSFHFGLSLTN